MVIKRLLRVCNPCKWLLNAHISSGQEAVVAASGSVARALQRPGTLQGQDKERCSVQERCRGIRERCSAQERCNCRNDQMVTKQVNLPES